ncbi:hypothetical protein [Maribacter arenosus]|uniref:HEPN domain-containing protein n=1 Tax=Maribacter arenosus TaxID=1854708 RepID=A0ABR7VII3_9FLAO|nr:hypothetical protein [Maribacter arenosus]MBD0851864.1 hypothetical protein [Maribacter arenosus]
MSEYPNKLLWDKRQKWIENKVEKFTDKSNYLISEHAVALFFEAKACYCLGAWITVVILSISIIDAHLRETEAQCDKIGTARLLEKYCKGNEDITVLRQLRNSYVHCHTDKQVLSILNEDDLERRQQKDAEIAIDILIKALFQSPDIGT